MASRPSQAHARCHWAPPKRRGGPPSPSSPTCALLKAAPNPASHFATPSQNFRCCSTAGVSSPAGPVCSSWDQDDLRAREMHYLLREKAQHMHPLPADENGYEPSSPRAAARDDAASTRSVGVPVYVMLPLDTIVVQYERDGTSRSVIQDDVSLDIALRTLKEAGVEGVMVDVWWGIVEREAPGVYDFAAYKLLFHKVASAGLKLQAVMSFHAAGGNVGDTCHINLPAWVDHVGYQNPDIFFTDRERVRNRECLSLGCDREPLFWGQSPLEVYEAFFRRFCDEFQHLFGSVICEVTMGCGPAGEARYPSYPEGDRRWRFPGIGEFQCYDRYMLEDLKRWADKSQQPDWGKSGPHDAGGYCSHAEHTGFFKTHDGNWESPYGKFFLKWYSDHLLRHVGAMLDIGQRVLNEPRRPRVVSTCCRKWASATEVQFVSPVRLGIKLAGVHWGYRTPSHPAEATAGYYNVDGRDGYQPFFQLVAGHGGVISFTCVEMRDCEHPPESACSPELLLRQIIDNAQATGVPLTGENALQRYDHRGLHRIRETALNGHRRGLDQLTFLRMGNLMFDHWNSFTALVAELQKA